MDHTYQSNLNILCTHDKTNVNIPSDNETCAHPIEALIPLRHKVLDPWQDSHPSSLHVHYSTPG